MPARFFTKAQAAEELNVSDSLVYSLIRRGDLRHIKVGGRGVQRIERSELERAPDNASCRFQLRGDVSRCSSPKCSPMLCGSQCFEGA